MLNKLNIDAMGMIERIDNFKKIPEKERKKQIDGVVELRNMLYEVAGVLIAGNHTVHRVYVHDACEILQEYIDELKKQG